MGEEHKKEQAIVDPLDPSFSADQLWIAFSKTMRAGWPHTVARLGRLCGFGVDDESKRLELREHDIDTLRDQLTRKVRPQRLTEDGPADTRIPNEAVQAILKRPLNRLDELGVDVPRVDRIVDMPVFGPDMSLVSTQGHHPEARLFYKGDPVTGLTEGWDDAAVRDHDVGAARDLLLDELLGDFPFDGDASRAHALALVVEQFARGMINGSTPAYTVIAVEQGTGKSLLAQACLLPACGVVDLSPEPEAQPGDFQKRLLSELIRGPQAIVFDNVTRELESSALAAMLTSGRYADRVLGKSQILSFPIRHTTVFTMNNPEIGPDMRRRVIPIYLDAGVERPWERSGPRPGAGWRHPNLLQWTHDNRVRLVRAAITLVSNYVEGAKDAGHGGEEIVLRSAPPRAHGSFQAWSQVVGGIVTAAGVPGFGTNLDRLFAEQSDADSDEAAFFARWPDGRKLSAAEVVQLVTVGLDGGLPAEAPEALRDRRSGRVDAQSVGNGLRQLRGRVRGGRRLENDRQGRPTLWYVEGT